MNASTFNIQPLPYPAQIDAADQQGTFRHLSQGEILEDLTIAAQNVHAGPVFGDMQNAVLYDQLSSERSGLLYAALNAGATAAQRQAANVPAGPHYK